MRAYSSAVVATALGVTSRWLDTVVTIGRIPGVQSERQGKSRAFTPRAIVSLAVAFDLAERFGASLPVALDLADRLVSHGALNPTSELSLHLDVAAVERRITLRLADAVEANPPARRGRPPGRRRSGQ